MRWTRSTRRSSSATARPAEFSAWQNAGVRIFVTPLIVKGACVDTAPLQRLPRPGTVREETCLEPRCVGYVVDMSVLVIVLAMIVLLALGVLGAVVKGLLWLTVVAAIVLVGGAVLGSFKMKGSSST